MIKMAYRFIKLNPSSLTRESVRNLYLDLSIAIDELSNGKKDYKAIKNSLNVCIGRLKTMLIAVNKLNNLIPEIKGE